MLQVGYKSQANAPLHFPEIGVFVGWIRARQRGQLERGATFVK